MLRPQGYPFLHGNLGIEEPLEYIEFALRSQGYPFPCKPEGQHEKTRTQGHPCPREVRPYYRFRLYMQYVHTILAIKTWIVFVWVDDIYHTNYMNAYAIYVYASVDNIPKVEP